jgi:hypothetical protein
MATWPKTLPATLPVFSIVIVLLFGAWSNWLVLLTPLPLPATFPFTASFILVPFA